MEKIDLLGGAVPFHTKRESKRIDKKEKPIGFFSSLLGRAESERATYLEPIEPSEDSLEGLLDEIYEIGESLKGDPTLENLRRYKGAVKSFFEKVVKRSIRVEERLSGANILKRKKYLLLQVIDRKLEQLAASVVSNQRENLDLLEKIDEIHGLLVDLLR